VVELGVIVIGVPSDELIYAAFLPFTELDISLDYQLEAEMCF
jgi:hypothetical protein